MPDVVVIGAGVNGLVAACALARERRSVLVLERQPSAGGSMLTVEIAPGFRAPVLSHSTVPLHARVLRQFVLASGRIEVVTPDVVVTTLGSDGSAISIHRDPAAAAASIHAVSPADATRWADFRQTVARLRDVLAKLYEQPPPRSSGASALELLRFLSAGRQSLKLPQRDLARLARWIPMSIGDLTAEWFEHDLLKAAIASHALFGNFAGPRSGGTGGMWLQRVLADPEPTGSSTLRRGGPGALPDALVATLEKLRGAIRTNAHVTRIDVEDGRVRGVTLDTGEQIAARAVVAAIDPRQTLLSLLDPTAIPSTVRENAQHYRVRGVTAKINLALGEPPVFPAVRKNEGALHGRLLVAPGLDYIERAFDAAKYGAIPAEPWLDISVPSMSDPTLAPAGQHVMSIAVHYAPRHLRGTSWSTGRETLWQNVLSVLERHTRGLASAILARDVITPEDLEARWGLSGGHIFHGETTIDQSWIVRPVPGCVGYRTPVRGLVLSGAGTHPAGGGAGLAGLFAANATREQLRRR